MRTAVGRSFQNTSKDLVRVDNLQHIVAMVQLDLDDAEQHHTDSKHDTVHDMLLCSAGGSGSGHASDSMLLEQEQQMMESAHGEMQTVLKHETDALVYDRFLYGLFDDDCVADSGEDSSSSCLDGDASDITAQIDD